MTEERRDAPEVSDDLSGPGPRKVMITGGAGFIGSHVADAFLARGDRVWIVDDLSSGKRENLPPEAVFVHQPIEDPQLRDLFREVRFDLVSHHAAQIDVRRSVADPHDDARTNVLGLLNVLEGCRETRVGRVVYISSGGVVYGEPEVRPTPETAPKLPRSPYGVTKLAGEHYLHYYRTVHGLDYVALRYANVYGPRQDPHGEAGVVALFLQRLLAGEELSIFGDGAQTRDYVFVGDVVRANLLAAEFRVPPGADLDDRAFNVGTGVETSVNRLADVLETISGRKTGRSFRSPRKGELQRSSLHSERLQGLGWSPTRSLPEGLRETLRWIESRMAAAAPEAGS